jgi:6-phosphogluconolactonase
MGALTISVFSKRALPSQRTRNLRLYVGTYTSGRSEGIYTYLMDQKTGELKHVDSVKAINPSFLTIDRQRKCLYAVNEVANYGGESSGSVSSFSIDARTGKLDFLNQQSSGGADPCHLTVDRKRRFLLVANYTGGNLSVLPIRRDGSLESAVQLIQHEGAGIKEQQKGPHAHCIMLDSTNRYALATDLGIDKVMIYRFNSNAGKLTPGKQPWAQLVPGAGPRHLTIHPNGRFAYVINELDSTMSVYGYDGVKGTLRPIETVSTLPDGFTGPSNCADLHLSPSGKFLYGSNRGHNSIVVFAVNARNGRLKLIEHVSTQGNWPRNFTIDPAGRFLLVANQRSDSVVTLRIDPTSGRLISTGLVAEIPSPVCLLFA